MRFITTVISLFTLCTVTFLFGCQKLTVEKSKETEILVGGPKLNTDKRSTGYDDGSQMENRFRINYAGYLPLQEKIAVYLYSGENESVEWQVLDSDNKPVLTGSSSDYRENDFASGDSFFLIDFTSLKTLGDSYRLAIGKDRSKPFDISKDVYKGLQYEFFDYFSDHHREGDVFDRYVHNWNDYSLTLNFIADAGDQGYYPVNAAEAQWSLISMLEQHPESNTYYSSHAKMNTVYKELDFFNYPMDKIIIPGQKLALAKLHTNSNDTWAVCTGAEGSTGSCVSKPETKATYSVARTLAAMSRLHKKYGTVEKQKNQYQQAEIAFQNAESEPLTCLTPNDVGGEGGYYPNNDNWSLWREPRTHRDPCASGKEADPKDNNVNDDRYAAIAELYLSAVQFGLKDRAEKYKSLLESHPHHNRVDLFWWAAVSTEGTVSLLIHQPEGLDLSQAETNLYSYADQVLAYQKVGYPGVTFDTQSDIWNSNDRDEVDNNFRWASNRMQLNDARLLALAAELSFKKQNYQKAIDYTNGTLRVMDQISGTNAVALAMFTADSYPHIEHAVSRTHDGLVPDTEDGKLALGPNNWTLSNDPNMPAFGSEPGMKMFALTGTGWASREISIDGNGSLVPVAYFASEIAPRILEQSKLALK